ncbi:hypothetical protein SAMN05660649_02276 [Desulfotomaculum arcticum]|uniref:Uncharacterized protein n=1 Tax=Desulfotruncus arcticus DSM 17038 TaxID=1121424 RepID=A0A1I2TI66_9FIRM|nr:hypothetical protein [Desulfotruncus arcticus]SFG64604.1 hypothetical protein SAMN05660649_02276 [Desulfotomaculum arcticum] [Desulfotruncus arcticus DSM 17038]
MAKKNKQEVILTPSGHEVDRDLARVPIKVSPSLQALIANQIELIDMIEGNKPLNKIFLEQHRTELLQVEGEVEVSFLKYAKKKEAARERRLSQKKEVNEVPVKFANGPDQLEEENKKIESRSHDEWPERDFETLNPIVDREETGLDQEAYLDVLANKLSPGLPSSKYDNQPKPVEEKKTEIDVRRVALGASIKVLQDFLDRELTEEEMLTIEAQVDQYLPASAKE